uniref:Synapse defective Rho GTPase homolog 2 n=1 Tax=Astyanax mexicanus TaxID=7994 RepID=W5K9S3_ASTMX
MADPLRRSLLAKLRGKKSKKAAVANGTGGGERGGKFRAKVSPTATAGTATTAAAADSQSGRAVAAVELDPTSSSRGGKQARCLNGGLDGGVVRLVTGLRDEQTGLGDSFRLWDQALRGREQLAGGDSIGFGNDSWDRSELKPEDRGTVKVPEAGCKDRGSSEDRERALETRDWDGGVVLDQGASSVSLRAGTGSAEAAEITCISSHLLHSSHSGSGLFHLLHTNVDDLDLIRSVESSFEGDLRMPALQSPSFFPTELEIVDSSLTPRLVWDREGSNRPNSVDSEEDDYYDNEILPFYESEGQNLGLNGGAGAPLHSFVQAGQETDSTEETDRLRNQLKEAYYLLINTMHDMAFDGPAQSSRSGSSSQSRDSVRSTSSHSSTRLADTYDDTCSSGEQSGQQACGSHWALLDLAETCRAKIEGSRRRSLSMQCMPHESRRPAALRRSISDSGVQYCTIGPGQSHGQGTLETENTKASKHTEETASLHDQCPNNDPTDQRLEEPHIDSKNGSISDPLSVQNMLTACETVDLHKENLVTIETEASVSNTSPVDHSVSCLVSSPDASSQKPGPSVSQQLIQSVGKPPGVTVNKMQEWMHKGRVLSSEMRQRIAGSSLRQAHGQDIHVWPKAPSHPAKPSSTGSSGGGPQPALMSSCSASCHESDPRAAPLNSITVSKKRNWLHQSSPHPPHHPDNVPAPRTPDDDHLNHAHMPHVTVSVSSPDTPSPLLIDPVEENDADDEGEIWYNPIPEDEETDLPHCIPTATHPPLLLQAPPPPWTAGITRRASAGGEEGRAGEGGGPVGEAGKANVTHSCEQNHMNRQMCRPDVQENPPTRTAATESSEQSASGFSPPSSPNPTKKSSSINWSFHDRIKSPRTVRKLSMKMKKLPELSRKLSVKGNPTSSAGTSSGQSEVRAAIGTAEQSMTPPGGVTTSSASGNVIWRYHLDSSVSTQQHSYSKKKSSGGGVPKSASKGGYLSDGDSPELVAKSGKHGSSEGKSSRLCDKDTNAGALKTDLDVDAFRPYNFSEQPKCTAYISGLMSLHFYGAEGLKPPRADSRHVYCAIQVDSVNKARTALLTCRTAFLDMDHTFNIELENAQHLKLALFSWEAVPRRNRVCCHGTVVLPPLFRTATRTHQLAVRLEPRGIIYVKLGLMEQWKNSLRGPDSEREGEANVFGVEAARVVEREGAGLMVPLIIEKCITEIERRGCQVVGLYRLCGSAAVKKELREAFERDSHAIELSESNYPDINVITGVLKDYLRELPFPLISKPLYEAVIDSMAKRPLLIGSGGCENDPAESEHTVSLLETLPEVEKMTLRKLLDHLKRVASHHEVNKMTCQNLAVCFGPVLLSQRQDASCHSNRVFVDSEELASALHFKKHIEVLHYLLQLWPVVDAEGKPSSPALDSPPSAVTTAAAPIRRRKERPQVLNLTESDLAGVLRPRPGRLDSPSNRYAGDWSDCRETYLQQSCSDEADYADVPGDELEERVMEAEEKALEQDDGELEEALESVEDTQADFEEERESDEEQSEETVSISPPQQQQQQEDLEEPLLKPWGEQILLERDEHRPKEHTYQAYMKIQEISPVLSNRVNLRDLQESIDTLIGNLERELNKNKISVGY